MYQAGESTNINHPTVVTLDKKKGRQDRDGHQAWLMNRFVHTDTPSPSPSPSHNPYNVAWCATPFALLMFNTSSRQQYRDCMMGMGLGCQYAQICSLTMLRVHPYLVSLSYHPYMPLFLISQDFLFTCLHSFLYTTMYYLCGRGQAPIKINNREKCLLSSWK